MRISRAIAIVDFIIRKNKVAKDRSKNQENKMDKRKQKEKK